MTEDTACIIPGENDNDDAPTGCGASVACNPLRRVHRYLMLIIISFISFGSYFCYDTPAALQDKLLDKLSLSVTQYMNLYAFYSWPNVILCFVGGFLIDKVFGIVWGTVFFSTIVTLSQLLFALGIYLNNIPLMYIARFFFGIGGESLCVAQNTYSTEWFLDTELNFVFGIQLSMSRVGSTVNMNTMQPIYQAIKQAVPNVTGAHHLGITMFIAAIFCVFSWVCAVVLGLFTKRMKRIKAWDCRRQRMADDPMLVLDGQDTVNPSLVVVPEEEPQTIQLKDVLKFPMPIWLICIICVLYYVTIFPFIGLGLVFFERKYDLDVKYAELVNSLVYIVAAVCSPIFGMAIDFTGKNLYWVIVGVVLTIGCHLCFAFLVSIIPPIVIVIVMGFAYSILASALWPLVSYCLPSNQRATAYGLIQSVQNLGLATISLLSGYIVDTKGYLFLITFYILCLSLALGASIMLVFWDLNCNNSKLNESGNIRRKRLDINLGGEIEPITSSTSSETRVKND